MSKNYLEHVAALYGKSTLQSRPKKSPINKIVCESESDAQAKVVTWLRKQGYLVYHIPNGGKRDRLEAFKFKLQGVSPGVPDLCIPEPRSPYHGLYLELKREKGGVVSEAQKWWIAELKKKGYCVEVAHGFNEAIKILEGYLHEPR
jgi:hypothetical protein